VIRLMCGRHRRRKHPKSGRAGFEKQAPKARESRRAGAERGGAWEGCPSPPLWEWVWEGGCAVPRPLYFFSFQTANAMVCFWPGHYGTLFGH